MWRTFLTVPDHHLPVISICLFSDNETNIVAQNQDLGFATCLNFGPNYYRTFDGLEYVFGGRCTYLLARQEGIWSVEMEVKNCDNFDTCRKVCIQMHRFLFFWKYADTKFKRSFDESSIHFIFYFLLVSEWMTPVMISFADATTRGSF